MHDAWFEKQVRIDSNFQADLLEVGRCFGQERASMEMGALLETVAHHASTRADKLAIVQFMIDFELARNAGAPEHDVCYFAASLLDTLEKAANREADEASAARLRPS